MADKLGSLAWSGFKLGFGLFSLAGVWTMAVIKNGALWAKDSDEEKRALAAAQESFWSLDREPLPGFKHAFYKTTNGTRLHYVVNQDTGSSPAKNVTIFLHGMYSPAESCRYQTLMDYATNKDQDSPILTSSGATSSNPLPYKRTPS